MDRRIDLGFVPLPVVEMNPDLEFEPVRQLDLMVALPPGHRLAKPGSHCESWLANRLCFSTALRLQARTTGL
jgi:DNA-binding transcriptional LysR family regulator